MKKREVKSVEEDLEEFLREEHTKEHKDKDFFPSWIKKTFLVSVALLCVFLITSFIYTQAPISWIILGQIQSQPVDTRTSTLILQDKTVIFDHEPLQTVFATYKDNVEVETSLCLEGTTDGTTYLVNNAYEPTIFGQSYTHVSHAACSDNTIIMFHTHPYKSCLASQTDLNTLQRNQEQQNPDMIMIVMCEQNRFSLYS